MLVLGQVSELYQQSGWFLMTNLQPHQNKPPPPLQKNPRGNGSIVSIEFHVKTPRHLIVSSARPGKCLTHSAREILGTVFEDFVLPPPPLLLHLPREVDWGQQSAQWIFWCRHVFIPFLASSGLMYIDILSQWVCEVGTEGKVQWEKCQRWWISVS